MVVAWLVVALIPLIAILFMLMVLVIASRRFRGVAVALLCLMLMACFGFALVASFTSYRSAGIHRPQMRADYERMHDETFHPKMSKPSQPYSIELEPQAVIDSNSIGEAPGVQPADVQDIVPLATDSVSGSTAANALPGVEAADDPPHAADEIVVVDTAEAVGTTTPESTADELVESNVVAEESIESAETNTVSESTADVIVESDSTAEASVASTETATQRSTAEHALADSSDASQTPEDPVPATTAAKAESAEPAAGSEVTSVSASDAEGTAEIADAQAIEALSDDSRPLESLIAKVDRRPDWVKSPPQYYEGSPAEVITSDPFVTRYECEDDLDFRIQKAITDYVRRQRRYAAGPPIPRSVIGGAEIQMVSRQQFVEMFDSSVGSMKKIHQLVVFDEDLARHVEDKAARAVVNDRLAQAGVTSGGVMLLVAAAFGLLKITTRPRKAA